MQPEQIEIELSKMKIFLIAVGSLLFVVLGIYLAFYSINNSDLFLKIVGLSSMAFFSLTFVASLIKIFDFKPGLIISKEGIYENSSFISLGFINWKDVLEVSKNEINHQKFVIIYLKDSEKYLQKAKGFKKIIAKINYRTYNSPVFISAYGLKTSFKDLDNLIKTSFVKYKKSTN